MRITDHDTESALHGALGARLAGIRLARDMMQAELATEAGIGLRTIQRLEQGAAATHLSGFLRVRRVLGLIEQLEILIPERTVSPIAQLKLRKQRRQRASRASAKLDQRSNWTWGTTK